MRKRSVLVATALAASALALAACSSSSSGGNSSAPSSAAPAGSSASAGGGTGSVGVILPDTKSSARWENNDRPLLKKAFDDAGIKNDIQNAQGDIPKFGTICDQMINEKVTVLIITDLDSPSGAACLKKASAAGIKTVDYDRLTLGGGASYYVSFDNVEVGKLQGEGLIKCLDAEKKTKANIVFINGAATDNNATLFKAGYAAALKSKIDSGDYKLVGDVSGEWKPDIAQTKFEQLLTQQKGAIDGAIVANDGMSDTISQTIHKNGLDGKLPITGQDATDTGLNRVLLGTQCMTVFKDVKLEAEAASKIAIALIKGQDAAALATSTVDDTQLHTKVPFVPATPVAITKDNVKDVITAGYTTAAKICTGDAAAVCTQLGIS
jgi:D-xylose transport system substrate-binding protein